MEWILTDDDCSQYRREIVKDKEYQLIEICLLPTQELGETYKVYSQTINLADYDLNDSDFIRFLISSYGYTSQEEVKEIYGGNAMGILAECIFESTYLSTGDVLFEGKYDECKDFIDFYAKKGEVLMAHNFTHCDLGCIEKGHMRAIVLSHPGWPSPDGVMVSISTDYGEPLSNCPYEPAKLSPVIFISARDSTQAQILAQQFAVLANYLKSKEGATDGNPEAASDSKD